MKKLFDFKNLGSVLLMLSVLMSSCKQEADFQPVSAELEPKTLKMKGDDWLKAPKITSFSELKAEIEVKNGNLHFKSSKDLKNVITFLRNAKKEEIVKWENSLSGFTSVNKFLDMAKDEFRRDTLNEHKFSELKVEYEGKVKFIDKDQRIKQIIPNGSIYGKIIGLNGEYRVGKSIVSYHKGKVISIPDGDESKLQVAKSSLKNTPNDGIFMHNLRAEDDMKALNTRNNDYGSWNWSCPNNCPVYTYRGDDGVVGNQKYWLTQEYDLINNSAWATFNDVYNNTAWDIRIDVSAHIDIEHRRKQWWGGYSPTYGGFNWGIGWGLDMNFNLNGVNYPAPYSSASTPTHQGGGWGWTQYDSDLEVDIPFWNERFENAVGPNQPLYFNFNSCIQRVGLVSSSVQYPTIISNQQYCQDGQTIF